MTWSATLWLEDIVPVDHGPLGVARLVKQYRGDQVRVQDVQAAFLAALQPIEDVSMDVLVGRWPLTAIGAQLDTLGEIVGQGRGQFTDDQYRLWILARILVNKANGRIEELINILELLGVTDIKIKEFRPAGLFISIAGYQFADDVEELIVEAKGGGITFHWVWSTYDDDYCFQMSADVAASDSDADSGFAGPLGGPYTSGGYLSGESVR